MIVQGMWEFKSPLLQLPHITEENLKYFSSKKVLKLERLTVLVALFLQGP
jgi:translocation protein SEC63